MDTPETLDKPIDFKHKSNILELVQADYTTAKDYTAMRMSKIYQWRKEYDGMLYGNEKKRKQKSKFVSRDIRKHSAWLQSSLIDPFTSTPDIVRCFPANPASTKAAKASEVVLNAQFCRQFNRFNFISELVNILETDGTVVIKTGWEIQEEKRKVKYSYDTPLSMLGQPLMEPLPEELLQQLAQEDPQQAQMAQLASTPMKDELGRPVLDHQEEIKEEIVPIINQPTAILCRNEDIFIDPTCLGDIEKAQFIIHRYSTDLSTLKADGRYENLEQLEIKDHYLDAEYTRDESFYFRDKARQKIIVYEYWGNIDINNDGIVEPVIVAWVNNTLIRCEENPYPDKKPPFIVAPFLPEPFDVYGEPNASLLSSNQKLKTAIYRGILDNMANSNNGQMAIQSQAIDSVNKELMLKGENFEVRGVPNQVIHPITYGQLPNSVFNVLQALDSESTQLTGVNTFGQYQSSNRIGEDNATKGLLDGGNLRKLHIVKSISENAIKPLLRKWLEYDSWLLEDEQIFRLSGGEYFETIKRDDLYGRIDIDLTISTNEDNAVRINQLSFLMQTIGPNEDPNIRKMIMSEIMKLHKMPELATRIENYEPQPDPLAEMAKQLQIEKLKAEIAELQANAGKIEQDGILKSAKAQAEGARAEETKARTDNINLDYVQKQQGLDRLARMSELQAQLDSKERIAQINANTKSNSDMLKLAAAQAKAEKEAELMEEESEQDYASMSPTERRMAIQNKAFKLKTQASAEPRPENLRKKVGSK